MNEYTAKCITSDVMILDHASPYLEVLDYVPLFLGDFTPVDECSLLL